MPAPRAAKRKTITRTSIERPLQVVNQGYGRVRTARHCGVTNHTSGAGRSGVEGPAFTTQEDLLNQLGRYVGELNPHLAAADVGQTDRAIADRKSTRLNSSHSS